MTMTVRVSRDSGQTFGSEVIYPSSSAEKPLTPMASAAWPPCKCPRCSSQTRKAQT